MVSASYRLGSKNIKNNHCIGSVQNCSEFLHGKNHCAFFIYLFHLCVADILKDVAVAAGIEKNLLYLWMRPVMVCVFVTAVAVMYGYGTVSYTHLTGARC